MQCQYTLFDAVVSVAQQVFCISRRYLWCEITRATGGFCVENIPYHP